MRPARIGVVAASRRRSGGAVTYPSIRSTDTYAPAVATTSHVLNKPAGTVSGDILVFFGVFPTNVTSPTITLPSGWTSLWTPALNSAAAGEFKAVGAYLVAGGSEPSTYTFTGSVSDRPAAVIVCVKDAASFEQADAKSVGSNTTSFTTNSITVAATNGALVLALFGTFVGGTTTLSWTPGSAFTEQLDFENANNHCGFEVAYKTTAPGSISSSATSSVAGGMFGGLVSLAAA